MKAKLQIECPVNFSPVNGVRVRLTAGFVFLLSVIYCLLPHWSIAALLMLDFFFRAFGFGRYSLLGFLSERIIAGFTLPYQATDGAAKEFAARLGFLMSDLLFICAVLFFQQAGFYISGLLACFSFLEGAFGFCAGCYVYAFYRKFLPPGKQRNAVSS